MNDENEKVIDLKDMLYKSAQKYANKTLYRLDNENISYQEMKNKVDCLGTALLQMGLKDKKIAIISENRYEWEIAYFAIACGTGVVVPIDKSLTKQEIITILKTAQVEAIFCSSQYENIILESRKELKELKYIVSFDGNDIKTISFNEMIHKGQELINLGNNNFTNAKINNESIGFIMFTSGTTAASKAVMLSHKNICSNLTSVAQVFPIDYTDVALSILPLNHVLEGLFCMLLTIYKGATRIHCKKLNDMIEDINKYKITFMGSVPAIYEYIYKRINEIDKNNINIFMCGGARLDSKIEEGFKNNGINLVQGYGATETAPVISMSNKEMHKIGSVGKIIPNIEVKLINKNEDGIGEIAVKGENVFLGYYQDKESTEQVLKDGYFNTKDLARIDEDGYIFLFGRSKNMIVLPNGKKVFPEEIESRINQINGVKEAFVFEKEIAKNKMSICAEIVCEDLKQNQEILNKIKELNTIIAQYQKISTIYITKCELLKNSMGKIKRKEELDKIKLNSYEEKNVSLESNTEDNKTLRKIKEIISKQLGIEVEKIKEEMTFNDLGADSLDKVEIIFSLEKEFNNKFPKEDLKEFNSIKDILEYENNFVR